MHRVRGYPGNEEFMFGELFTARSYGQRLMSMSPMAMNQNSEIANGRLLIGPITYVYVDILKLYTLKN